MNQSTDFQSILSKEPFELLSWLLDEFSTPIPETILSSDDMDEAGKTLLKLSGFYSYLMALSSYARLYSRNAKRTLSKEEYEDTVDRKEIIQNFTDIIKQKYAAVSRAVTIYMDTKEELKMGRAIP